jgi:hypothetical protein
MVRLAELISPASRVEPALLRQVRREFAPDLGPEIEADLWFGPLAESYGANGFVLDPEFAEILRERLTRRPERLLDRVAESIARSHAQEPESIRLEEKAIALALQGAPAESLEEILRPAVLAMRDPERSLNIARWLTRALPRLPEAALRTEAAFMLNLGASAQFGGRRILEKDFDGALPANAAWGIGPGLPAERVKIGVRLFETGLEIVAVNQPAATTIEVPATEPLWLEIAWRSGSVPHARTVQIYEGRVIDGLPPDAVEVTLRTLAGDVYRAEIRSVPLVRSPVITIGSYYTMGQIGQMLTDIERDGYDFESTGARSPVRLAGLIAGVMVGSGKVNIANFVSAERGSSEKIILVEPASAGGIDSLTTLLERHGGKMVCHGPVLVDFGEKEVAVCRVGAEFDFEKTVIERRVSEPRVYMRYRKEDAWEFAQRLEADLPGRKIGVRYELMESDVVLVVWSPRAADSSWVRAEIETAQRYAKPVIPIILFGGETVPTILRRIKFADFSDDSKYEENLAALVERIRNAPGADEAPESPEERAMGLADILQSIALQFHVRFGKSEVDPERARRFWSEFGPGRILNEEQFNRVRALCEWIIHKMVEEYVSPGWKQTPEGIDQSMTFPDFVKVVTEQAIELGANFSSELMKTEVELTPAEAPFIGDIIEGTGLEIEPGYRGFSVTEGQPGAALAALKRFSGELQELFITIAYDPWSAPSGDSLESRLRVLAALISGICRPIYLRPDRTSSTFHEVADAVQGYITPLWQRSFRELLAVSTPGISSGTDFFEFLRVFDDLVAALLGEALGELGDIRMESIPRGKAAWRAMNRSSIYLRRVLDDGEGDGHMEGNLSQFIELFRSVSDELMVVLVQARARSGGPDPTPPQASAAS